MCGVPNIHTTTCMCACLTATTCVRSCLTHTTACMCASYHNMHVCIPHCGLRRSVHLFRLDVYVCDGVHHAIMSHPSCMDSCCLFSCAPMPSSVRLNLISLKQGLPYKVNVHPRLHVFYDEPNLTRTELQVYLAHKKLPPPRTLQ